MTVSPIKLDMLVLDSAAQPRIEIDWVLVSEYAEAMGNGAKFPPIIVYRNGENWLADGFHRVAAAKQAGLSELAADIRQGDLRDAILYSVGANAENGKRRTNEDKRRAVMTLLQDEEWGKWSDNEIAKRCAVSQPFVSQSRASLITVISDTQERTYTTKYGTVATMHTANIGTKTDGVLTRGPIGNYHQLNNGVKRCDKCGQLWAADLDYCPYCNISREARVLFAQRERTTRPVSYHVSDDSYEWFTPAEYIEAARTVMGSIDLDPASCEEANKTIKAKRFYTKQDSGLDHEWNGNVWLNPPYNMPLIEDFANRAIESYKSGAIEQAIVLTNNSTDTGWFHALAEYPFCLTRGRVKFWQPNSEGLGARQGQAIFYLGKNARKFVVEFSKFGIIVARYEHCKS